MERFRVGASKRETGSRKFSAENYVWPGASYRSCTPCGYFLSQAQKLSRKVLRNGSLPIPHPLRDAPTKKYQLMAGIFYWILKVGADLLSPLRSTIDAEELNFRVRKGNGCTLFAKAPTLNIQLSNVRFLSLLLNTVMCSSSQRAFLRRRRMVGVRDSNPCYQIVAWRSTAKLTPFEQHFCDRTGLGPATSQYNSRVFLELPITKMYSKNWNVFW